MNSDRDAWTTYAEGRGLVRTDTPVTSPAKSVSSSAASPASRRNKYGARRVQVDGIWFDSVKESERYQILKYMQDAGEIAELELQPVFPLHVFELWRSQVPIQITTAGVYKADFRYLDLTTGEIVVEDTKSDCTKTEAYRLRKRLAELIHGMTVDEL
jgi:Protein of unknown function (DUF1064)